MRNVDYVVDIVSNAFTPYQWLTILIVASILTAFVVFLGRKPGESAPLFVLGLFIPPAVWAIALTVLHFVSFLQWLWVTPPLPA